MRNTDERNRRPMEFEIRLKGWKGVVGIVFLLFAVALFLSWRYQLENRRLTREAVVEAIEPWMTADQTRGTLDDLKRAVEARDKERTRELSRSITELEIGEIVVKGYTSPLVARVEVLVDGKPPASGPRYRYYMIAYDTLLGRWETGPDVSASYFASNARQFDRRWITRATFPRP